MKVAAVVLRHKDGAFQGGAGAAQLQPLRSRPVPMCGTSMSMSMWTQANAARKAPGIWGTHDLSSSHQKITVAHRPHQSLLIINTHFTHLHPTTDIHTQHHWRGVATQLMHEVQSMQTNKLLACNHAPATLSRYCTSCTRHPGP